MKRLKLFNFFNTQPTEGESIGNQIIDLLIKGIELEHPEIEFKDTIDNNDRTYGIWFRFSIDKILGYGNESIVVADITQIGQYGKNRLRAITIGGGKNIEYTNEYFSKIVDKLLKECNVKTRYKYKSFKREEFDKRRIEADKIAFHEQQKILNRLKFYEEIKQFESITPSNYKEWSQYFNWKFYKDIEPVFKKSEKHDKRYNRIYFDLSVDQNRWKVKIPQEIADFMGWHRYPIIDYNKGICRDKDGREIRIGRLFQRLGREDLLKVYSDSKQNTLRDVNNLCVVISRHPYDIIGISTGRGWTTCLDINDKRYNGEHLSELKSTLKRGCLVSYLVRTNDLNIKNPLSRILISKDYFDDGIYVDDHVYGIDVPEHKEFLEKWARKI